jgi:RHS repeat-associated protein
LTVTAKATGPASNYPISVSGASDFGVTSPNLTLSGGHWGGCKAYDKGIVTAQIAGTFSGNPFYYTASANWGQNDTAATVTANLANAINTNAGSVVTATPAASAGFIALNSKSTGAAANFDISVSVNDTMSVLYSYLQANPSFWFDVDDMTGGASADANYGTIIYSYAAGYAANGNILTHTDSVMGTWNFTYDAMDRLATAAAGSGVNVPSAFRGQSAAWSYDSFGNRTAQSFSGGGYSNWVNYNPANNRVTTASTAPGGYVYDASGNTLYDGNNEYWYDAEGQLCAVALTNSYGNPIAPITQYVYDAEGARIAKTTLNAAPANPISLCAPPLSSGYTLTARYLVDLGGDQVTEINGAGQWQHSNVFSAARLTATYDYNNGNGGLHYELADPLGTKRVQANISGQTEMSWISLPYGDALTAIPTSLTTADDATEHHFTQKERDTESNNDYFFARYYNSAMGRFTTPDWSAKVVPVPYAQMGNPQSLNLYAYVGNNPITHVDLDGHAGLDCSGNNAKGIGCMYKAAMDAVHGVASKVLDQVGSYLYGKGFKGTGEEVKIKVIGVTFEAGHKKGKEVTRHLNGHKEEKEIKSNLHAKVDAFGYSAGAERTVEGENSKAQWQFSVGRDGIEGSSGGQVGFGVSPCFGESCSGIEGGVEAGKMFQDLSNWMNSLPDPGPFTFNNK